MKNTKIKASREEIQIGTWASMSFPAKSFLSLYVVPHLYVTRGKANSNPGLDGVYMALAFKPFKRYLVSK